MLNRRMIKTNQPPQNPGRLTTPEEIFLITFSFFYGFLFSQIPSNNFKDFDNYLNFASNSGEIIIAYTDIGLFQFLVNEPVWLIINATLGLVLVPETIVRTIIFIGAFSIAYLILRYNPKSFFLLILILFLPSVIKNYLVHLRQGTGIAVFLLGWFALDRGVRRFLIGLTPLIHASFFIIIICLMLTKILNYSRLTSHLKLFVFSLFAIFLAHGSIPLAELMGARQGEQYGSHGVGVSGLGFVLWSASLLIMLGAKSGWLRSHIFEVSIIILYLAMYWVIPIAPRVFESGLILVLLAGLSLDRARKQLWFGLVIFAGIIDWTQRVGQPAFGFAVS